MDDEDYFNEKFWQGAAIWPRDREDSVFLARVIERIEKAMNPQPLLEPPELSPDLDDAEFERIEAAEAEYEAEGLRRRRRAVEQFVACYQAGKFECLRISKAGGHVQELPEPIWFSETIDHWFRFCDFSAEEREAAWSNARPWIFVSRPSVDAYFGEPIGPPTSLGLTQQYSPYMRLMIDVIRDLKITPEYQPTAESIREELKQRWPRYIGSNVSKNLVSAMATIIREIESGKGGYNKSQRKS